ncbi:MAG: hypothetical protein ACREV2_13460 [Burkholderiales bacterium]
MPVSADEQVIVLSRPKLRYARAGLPDIFIKRRGFEFTYQTDITKTSEEQAKEIQNQVHQFLVDQLREGRRYTARSLEEVLSALNLTRSELRKAIAALRVSGRIAERELPRDEQQGGRRTFLCPASTAPDPSAQYTSYQLAEASIAPDISTAPPPIGKEERRSSTPFSSFPDPAIAPNSTAQYGAVGAVDEKYPAGGDPTSQLNDLISRACAGVIDPELFGANLNPEDLSDIEAGHVSVEYLRCAAESMAKRLILSERSVGPLGEQVNESHGEK